MVSDKSHVPRQVGVPESRGLCLKLGVIDERDGAAIDSDGAAFLETTKSSSHNLASATNDLCDLALGEPALHIDTRANTGVRHHGLQQLPARLVRKHAETRDPRPTP